MTEFTLFNLTEFNIMPPLQLGRNVCVCCLHENIPLIKLSNCVHKSFFDKIIQVKLEIPDLGACFVCHSMLKKFVNFKQQVERSLEILYQQLPKVSKNQVNLTLSPIELFHTINSQPIEMETLKKDMPGEYKNNDIETEIKIEHESSDFEFDMPLIQVKDLKEKKSKKRKKREENKFDGKIRLICLSKEEMMEERQKDSLKESFLKFPFRCEYCITGFDHESILKEHMAKRHTKKKNAFVCEICNSVLGTITSFKQHERRHVRRYECVECGKRNNHLYSVVEHYNANHGSISTTFTCHLCGFTTESNRSYRYHKDKHKGKPTCTLCGKSFVNNTGLKTHMLTVHRQSSRVYTCNVCNKTYRYKSSLLAHNSVHSELPRVYCQTCKVQFRTETNLRHHLKTHSKHLNDADKRYVCDECGARFLTKGPLIQHIDWDHLNKKLFQCNKCIKAFKNNSALRKHYSFVHEKKRPPRDKICDHCGRGFTTSAILQCHIRTHTGERPLQCTHCPATFAHSAALYTHNKLLHGTCAS